ncbi:MAG: YicC/YloC family endoribonuclease, partial [Candidatus Zixiibacteriota bacterium]
MNSMTGFGKAERKTKLGSFTVEVSSVNNRFLDINTRMPRHFFSLEVPIRNLIGSMLSRGKVNIFVGFEESADSTGKFRINEEALESYHKQLRGVGNRLNIPFDIPISALLILPEVANPPRNGQDVDTLWADLEKISHKALSELVAMRRR